MIGMNESTGRLIEGEAWVRQSVRRAVRTPKGSMPMLRWYGTRLLKYLGQPITQGSVLELTSDLAESIEKTVPNASLDTVLDQRNGEELIVNLRIGPAEAQIGV